MTTLHFHFRSPPSSPCGKKFRSKPQIARFLGEQADLTAFDFSRGAGSPGDGTQRRKARDRNPTKTALLSKPMPLIRPLTTNPLRPSGPIRRTCGVIKLPVTWVAPPSNEQLRNNLVAGNPADPKQQSPINVIVQSLWEKRLFGVKAYDHMTGSEISPKPQNGMVDSELIKTAALTPIRKAQSPPCVPTPQPAVTSPPLKTPQAMLTLKQQLSGSHTATPPVPSLLPSSARPAPRLPSGHGQPATSRPAVQGHLASKDLIYLSLIQPQNQQPVGQQQSEPQVRPTNQGVPLQNGPSAASGLPLRVTDSELKIQEERVRLLRQQLMAAESSA